MLFRFLYAAAWWLLAPFAVCRLFWRARREPAYKRHIAERFGYAPAHNTVIHGQALIWIHAVSVGETHAAQPLIDALLAHYPQAKILITHMSPGGRARSKALWGERVLRCYLPYDMGWTVQRFLQHYQPVIGIIFETEIWPTLLHRCKQAKIPTVLVNARLSERSYQKYRRAMQWTSMIRETFASFTLILAQTLADASRLTALGASAVRAVGNMKFDIHPAPALLEKGQAWRQAIGLKRPVWIAASTREGEEALILEAFLHSGYSEKALLILVPRHAARFEEVATQLERGGWRFERRSAWNTQNTHAIDTPSPVPPLHKIAPEIQVIVGDSMGELAAYYAAADMAFIGGSLLPFGGQNLIEACAIGLPVLLGPYTFNFEQATNDAITAGAAQRIANAQALGAALRTLWENPSTIETMRKAAKVFATTHQGATQRTLEAIQTVDWR